jgi:hypothetical protein
MPAHQLDLQGFVQFVLDCTLDSRTTADAVPQRAWTGAPKTVALGRVSLPGALEGQADCGRIGSGQDQQARTFTQIWQGPADAFGPPIVSGDAT